VHASKHRLLWNVGGFTERLPGSTDFLVLYPLAGLLGSITAEAGLVPSVARPAPRRSGTRRLRPCRVPTPA